MWLTEALERPDCAAQGTGGELRRRCTDGVRGRGCRGGAPGLLIRREDAGSCCEREPGVSDARDSPAVCNYGGG